MVLVSHEDCLGWVKPIFISPSSLFTSQVSVVVKRLGVINEVVHPALGDSSNVVPTSLLYNYSAGNQFLAFLDCFADL